MIRENETLALFVDLVCLGIGHSCVPKCESVDWKRLQELATAQGLTAVVLDGLDRLTPTNGSKVQVSSFKLQIPDMPKKVRLEWIGEVLQGYEYRYELYRRAIAELADFYNAHGFQMMVLKGYACSLDWPKPEHRPSGDIDIWQFGKQKEADAILTKEKHILIESDRHHHTSFFWRDFMVENHYDFINVHHHNTSLKI